MYSITKKKERLKIAMSPFEIIATILNLIAVLSIPVVAVVVGQKLQEKSEKRKDKMKIFQCLMTRRTTGWANPDAVDALNTIDIVFSDSEEVRKQWHILYDKYRPVFHRDEQYKQECKLLESMANNLGYKDKITWETIQSPYYPVGLDNQITRNTTILQGQEALAKAVGPIAQMIVAQSNIPESDKQEDNPNANT